MPAPVATWAEEIPWVLLGLRSQQREDTGLSLAEAVFGTLWFYPVIFCRQKSFPLIKCLKIFPKSKMLLFFLCIASTTRATKLPEELPGNLP
jgi:hypothetical protein